MIRGWYLILQTRKQSGKASGSMSGGRKEKRESMMSGWLASGSTGRQKQARMRLSAWLCGLAGHAVSAAHISEHAMVASDYAVIVICLLHPDCMEAVRQERLWQIHHLQEIKSTIQQTSVQ